MRQLSTRTPLRNSAYPCMITSWTEDEDSLGWTGSALTWKDGNTKESGLYEISVRQTTPLGGISAMVDPFSHGAWASTSFEGTVLAERDLQWAAAWASAEIKRKNEFLQVREEVNELP